jgi:hypothetical protein
MLFAAARPPELNRSMASYLTGWNIFATKKKGAVL